MTQPNTPLFLGIDLGTGSCKAVLLDDSGQARGFGQGDYPPAPARRWDEQDPQGLLVGLAAAVRNALENAQAAPEQVAALSLGSAMHSLIALDRHGDPLTGVMTWADGRGARQAAAVRAAPLGDALYHRTACPPHGMYPLYKLLWMREEQPDLFAAAARFVTIKEFALERLTGDWLLDPSLGGGHGLMNAHSLAWDELALATAGIRREQLPILALPVQRSLLKANAIGLLPGTPVYLGCSDAVNSSLGAGGVLPGSATLMVGTSGALRLVTPQPVLHPQGQSWCYPIDPAHYLVGGALNNGGIPLTWLRDLFNQAAGTALDFDDVLALAGQAPAGAGGLLCLPFLAGERSPIYNENARGVFFGLSYRHEARHLARALLEGTAYRFRALAEMMAVAGCAPQEIRASGGFVRSALWLNLTSAILNQPLLLPAWGETSCWGAAAWALIGSGAWASLEEAAGRVRLEGSVQPDPADAARYARIYPLTLRLYEQTRALLEELPPLE